MSRRARALAGFPGWAVTLVLLAWSCAAGRPAAGEAGDGARVLRGPADIRGSITRLDDRQLLVEENPGEETGSPKAWVRLTATTEILDAAGKSLGVTDLRKGQIVAVWFDGPAAESYPLQAKARTIVVEGGSRP